MAVVHAARARVAGRRGVRAPTRSTRIGSASAAARRRRPPPCPRRSRRRAPHRAATASSAGAARRDGGGRVLRLDRAERRRALGVEDQAKGVDGEADDVGGAAALAHRGHQRRHRAEGDELGGDGGAAALQRIDDRVRAVRRDLALGRVREQPEDGRVRAGVDEPTQLRRRALQCSRVEGDGLAQLGRARAEQRDERGEETGVERHLGGRAWAWVRGGRCGRCGRCGRWEGARRACVCSSELSTALPHARSAPSLAHAWCSSSSSTSFGITPASSTACSLSARGVVSVPPSMSRASVHAELSRASASVDSRSTKAHAGSASRTSSHSTGRPQCFTMLYSSADPSSIASSYWLGSKSSCIRRATVVSAPASSAASATGFDVTAVASTAAAFGHRDVCSSERSWRRLGHLGGERGRAAEGLGGRRRLGGDGDGSWEEGSSSVDDAIWCSGKIVAVLGCRSSEPRIQPRQS